MEDDAGRVGGVLTGLGVLIVDDDVVAVAVVVAAAIAASTLLPLAVATSPVVSTVSTVAVLEDVVLARR